MRVVAGIWIDRDHGGTLVLAFTDDPAAHLEAVLARGPSPDDLELVSPRPPIADPPEGSALEGVDQKPPPDGWFVLDIGDEVALFGHGSADRLLTARMGRTTDGDWVFEGWSLFCALNVSLPAGLGRVKVVLDPDHDEPQPDDTMIHVLVTEQTCTRGSGHGRAAEGPAGP